ncbi:hypothetical protein EV192_10464 [Actinocrispum wychmicini]|uniref:PIN like domain-containing protein n=2 Tax=Actinocrispum wychmicini TaxID=1213861 RepID=A0A4R2JHB0_9PSEU|nr:hypothetical protein EV192_10464 [Actinocrispum wychmicini]
MADVVEQVPPEDQSPAQGRGLFDGYEMYRTPTDAEYRNVLTSGLVVLDTNVLLNLYRYTAQARADFLSVLHALQPNLWIPERVIDEFWNSREGVLRNPRRTAETLKQLDSQRSNALTQINQWAKLASLSSDDTATMVKTLRTAFDSIRDTIEEHEDDQVSSFAQDTNSDSLLGELEPILDGRVGPRLNEDEYQRLIDEGKRRLEAEIAPGFCDVKAKGLDGAVGDYLVWEQLLQQASIVRRDVLIVTAENKPDWWRMERGELRGPHPHLINELRERAGVQLFMLQPNRLLDYAKAALQISVHEGSSESVARVNSSLADEGDLPTGGWNAGAISELLTRLDREAPVQAAAIRQAAKQGGYISRDDVYELGEYDPERRQLKGFTRPIKRIVQELRDRGVIPEEALDVLGTRYDHEKFGWASGFTLTEELVPLLLV